LRRLRLSFPHLPAQRGGIDAKRAALTLGAFLLLACALQAEELVGKVVGVVDGDTIDVLVDKTPVRIRLYGIDSPEKGGKKRP